jgi:hypothetical protein
MSKTKKYDETKTIAERHGFSRYYPLDAVLEYLGDAIDQYLRENGITDDGLDDSPSDASERYYDATRELSDDWAWEIASQVQDLCEQMVAETVDLDAVRKAIDATPRKTAEQKRVEKMRFERCLARDLGMKVADYRALPAKKRGALLSKLWGA